MGDPEFVSGSSGEGRLTEISEEGGLALLVGTYAAKSKGATLLHLDELERLADTYGLTTKEKMACPLRKVDAATYLGKGKIAEISELVAEKKIDIVIFDDEITPQQQRNLEKTFQAIVIDRTELILGVFAQRAQTKEARIQVQLAQFRYQLPRLRRMWTHLSRQRVGGGGKGGFLKGEGERQIEIDRRLLRERIDRLQKDLKVVQKQREVQRAKRQKRAIPTFAIIGYTNAGKSTLLNALTKAKVFVEDKLFATLDTTTRKFLLPNNQEILLIDTVGFIRKLPHNLVASFKSTLEEAVHADILLHLVDSSSETAMEEIEATYEVLKEMDAEKKPIITVLNKIDLEKKVSSGLLRFRLPKVVEISAITQKNFDQLINRMIEEVARLSIRLSLRLDQKHYAYVGELMEKGHVISSVYEGNDIVLDVEVPKELVHKFEKFKIN